MVGILYESKEWSSYKLRDEILAQNIECELIDLEEEGYEEAAEKCSLLINRVFASSVFRGHRASLLRVERILEAAKKRKVRVINPPEAHRSETSKLHSMKLLAQHGILVPGVYGAFLSGEKLVDGEKSLADGKDGAGAEVAEIHYPCIIKPDCGGRTTLTYLVKDEKELREAVQDICTQGPKGIPMILCEYIFPEKSYITRVEVIGGKCRLIVTRSIAENGLSAYHLGSRYTIYEDCPEEVKELAERACAATSILMGSLDIIETSRGAYVIDVNAVSNVSEDNTEMFHFDLMKEYAIYIAGEYRKEGGKPHDDH